MAPKELLHDLATSAMLEINRVLRPSLRVTGFGNGKPGERIMRLSAERRELLKQLKSDDAASQQLMWFEPDCPAWQDQKRFSDELLKYDKEVLRLRT